MKRKFKSLLCLALSAVMIMGMSVTSFAAEGTPDENTSTTVITNPDEIEKFAADYDLPENPDDIVQIIVSDVECPVNENVDVPTPAADFLNPEEIVFKITYHNPSKRGMLLRSSDYSYPGGQMTVSESVEVTYSTTAGLSAEVVSTEIGFSVGKSVTVSDTQNVEVPSGQKRTCNAYVKLDHYEFDVIGDDIWFDDDLGTGTVDRPVGVIFVITK